MEKIKEITKHEKLASTAPPSEYWEYFCSICAYDENMVECVGCRMTDAEPSNFGGVEE